ncbi:hypothetical protein MNV_30005 [Candidatus Methanoperedens nitroreducens]|uniref:Uncharacterized protein n=1 Tax=Candidatus Methanoperedens nitratireducens TaxID=1392998 RepID=A0A284VPU0_9EURY|nr:hypothetical protein MNV_30005 [Candidatus Methanoperedens nitroreducens]
MTVVDELLNPPDTLIDIGFAWSHIDSGMPSMTGAVDTFTDVSVSAAPTPILNDNNAINPSIKNLLAIVVTLLLTLFISTPSKKLLQHE